MNILLRQFICVKLSIRIFVRNEEEKMEYYQARISNETAQLLEMMRIFYQNKTGGNVTKGDCLMMSYQDSLWVKDWNLILNSQIPYQEIKNYEISSTAKLLKIQISNEVREGIQQLKTTLPNLIGTRSVTIGVCIREILKASYIKNFDIHMQPSIISEVYDIFKVEKINIIESENIANKEQLLKILNDIELKIIAQIKL